MWVATAGVAKVYICPLTGVGGLTWPRECARLACYSGRMRGMTLTKTLRTEAFDANACEIGA